MQVHDELISGIGFTSPLVGIDYASEERRQQLDNRVNTVPESIERIDCYAYYADRLWHDNSSSMAQEQRRSAGNYFAKLAALVKLKARNGLTNNPGFKSYFRKRVRDYLLSELKDLIGYSGIPTSDMRLQLGSQPSSRGFAPSFVEQLDLHINTTESNEAIQSAKLIGLVNNRHILIGFFGLAYLQLVLLQVENTGSLPFNFMSGPYRALAINNNVAITWEPGSTPWPLLLPLQELDVVRFFSSADYRRTATNLDCGGLNTLNPSYPALTRTGLERTGVFHTGFTEATLRRSAATDSGGSSWYNEARHIPRVADQFVQAVPANPSPQQVLYTTEASLTNNATGVVTAVGSAAIESTDIGAWAQYMASPSQQAIQRAQEADTAARLDYARQRERILHPPVIYSDDEEALF